MKFLQDLYSKFDGKKTYLVALLTVVYALIGHYVLKTVDFTQFVNYLLAAGAVFGFRSALNK